MIAWNYVGIDIWLSQQNFISSHEPKTHKVNLYDGTRAGVSNASWPIAIKFYLKHHWGGVGEVALGYWPDRVRIMVYMATDSSHRVIMGKIM